MLISLALASDTGVDPGSSGDGNALLIVLGIAITLGAVYVLQKRLRNRMADREESTE